MNPSNGRPSRRGFFGPDRIVANGPGTHQDRRRFQPAVADLEVRQLMSNVPAVAPITTVATFKGPNELVIGARQDGAGNLLGTTSIGWSGGTASIKSGSVFEISKGSTSVATLASFDGLKGDDVNGVVEDSQGNLFGTTGDGGTSNEGTVFEIAKGSSIATTVATFDGTNGQYPSGLVMDSQGNLYGTTAFEGPNNPATAFEIPHGTSTIATIAIFLEPGSAPKGLVVDGQGDLFGTNQVGAAKGTGTVFEIAQGSKIVTNLVSFPNQNGTGLSGVTLDGYGDLFGTTEDGGINDEGSVFEIVKGSNTVTTLASFNGTDGSTPDPDSGVVIDGKGNLYGSTEAGASNGVGAIFEIPQGSGKIVNLNDLKSSKGTLISGLLWDDMGNLYGTTNDGSGNQGTVFKITPNPGTATSTVLAVPSAISGTKKVLKVVAVPQQSAGVEHPSTK